jgi:hypothetical protein
LINKKSLQPGRFRFLLLCRRTTPSMSCKPMADSPRRQLEIAAAETWLKNKMYLTPLFLAAVQAHHAKHELQADG